MAARRIWTLGLVGVWVALIADSELRGLFMLQRWRRSRWFKHAQRMQALAAGQNGAFDAHSQRLQSGRHASDRPAVQLHHFEYGRLGDGHVVHEITLSHGGLVLSLITLGGIVTTLWGAIATAVAANVVRGFDNLDRLRAIAIGLRRDRRPLREPHRKGLRRTRRRDARGSRGNNGSNCPAWQARVASARGWWEIMNRRASMTTRWPGRDAGADVSADGEEELPGPASL